ncbi:MAG: tetratricopeptide repeat protein [Planctomycetota bacterium]
MLCALALGAYYNSFSVPFQFDDFESIARNGSIRSFSAALLPPPEIGTSGRPILNLSFAVNYALSRLNVGSYHVVNLAIHVLAGLVLFGLIRRTLLVERFGGVFRASAAWIAFVVAALWLVHPLQTMCVTYIVQRAESLMALFYLLTMYCSLRGATEARPVGWQIGAVAACIVGMGTKEVMATAPLAVLVFDRTFLSGSFAAAVKRRGSLYAGLAFSWVILAVLAISGPRSGSAGFGLKDWSVLEYARTQPEVILHYLMLASWPHPLVIDYDWPIATSVAKIVPAVAAVLILMGLSIRGMMRGATSGSVGVLFFLVLSVTSSFVPINIIASEHRMYLPLAAVLTLVVVTAHRGLARLSAATGGAMAARFVGGTVFVGVCAALMFRTVERNRDYQSADTLWSKTLEQRPMNPRALNSMGYVCSAQGRPALAIPFYRRAIELRPAYVDAHFNLAEDLHRLGQHDEAANEYEFVLHQTPEDYQALVGLGGIHVAQGRLKEAIELYQKALSIRQDDPITLSALGIVLAATGRLDDAVALYEKAVAASPEDAALRMQLGSILARMSRFAEAGDRFEESLRLNPTNVSVRYRLGLARLSAGRPTEALIALRLSARDAPADAEVRLALGKALVQTGDTATAVPEFRKALELNPNLVEAQGELAWILATNPDETLRNAEEAVRLGEAACQATEQKNFVMLDTLGTAYASAGRFSDAIRVTNRALALARAAKQSVAEQKITERLAGYRKNKPFRMGGGKTAVLP